MSGKAVIAGLVLAAGEGRRMGRPKALIEIDGERLVDRAVRALRDGGCDPVYVVLGAADVEVPDTIPVKNVQWRSGMASSLRAGLAAVTEQAAAVVIVLVDQPDVGADTVRRVVTRLAAGDPLVVATYDGKRGHPVGLVRSLWAEVAMLAEGDAGAREFISAHPELRTAVECSDVGKPFDLDTEEELAAYTHII